MTQLQQAIAAIESGDKETGKRLLAWVLHDEPQNEAAWLWMSYAVDDIGQKRDCLGRVLSINPNNEQAQNTLELLDAQHTIAVPEPEPRRTIERPEQPFPNLLEQEIKRRTKRGWQLVSHSDTLVQFRKPRQWSGLGILLFVVLPLLVGCVLTLFDSVVGIGAFIIAVMGFLFVVADYLLKKDKLVTVTVEELEQQRRQRNKRKPIRKIRLPTWLIVLLVLGAIVLPIAVCLSFRVAPTTTPISAGRTDGFVDCLACARQHPWLIYLRSEPGRDAGTAVGGLRHADEIEVLDAHWHSGEGRWWYKVTGWDEYTKDVGNEVTGWVSETNVTVGVPEQYPLGTAWIEFEFGIQADLGGDVIIWDRPRYYSGQGQGIGSMWHGTSVQISDSEWDPDYGIWTYEITGVDCETKETITGWLDGTFLVLAPPP
jgi:hypothetical protein